MESRSHNTYCISRMWLTSGRASRQKTLLQYSSLTPLERECYEGEVQPYRKTDYKPIIYIYIVEAASRQVQQTVQHLKAAQTLFFKRNPISN